MRFIKTLFVTIFTLCMTVMPGHADIATVGGVHEYITQQHSITLPHSAQVNDHTLDMEYLMTLVDSANAELNNGAYTSYATNPQYASRKIATSFVADYAVNNLIKKKTDSEYTFSVVPASTGTTFEFTISASGTFYVDCDNGADVQVIDKQNTDVQTVTCEYSDAANKHTVGLGGLATGYAAVPAAISFADDAAHVRSVAGCLACIFPSFGDESGRYPRFYYTFADNTELTSVPATLFRDYTVGGDSMFRSTFSGCTKLATVPDDLFAGITVAGHGAFHYTFAGCTALTVLGDNWFQNLVSIQSELSLAGIFDNSGVTKIGDGWFPKLTSAPPLSLRFGKMGSLKSVGDGWFPAMTTVEHSTFQYMFAGQPSLESVGSNWFPNLTHAGERAFLGMFEEATALKSVGDGWFPKLTTADNAALGRMFMDATSLESVGSNWFPKLTTVGNMEFIEMFYGTTSLRTIPAMFKNIKSAQEYLFNGTFGNSGLTAIPDDMFASLDTSGSYPYDMFSGTFKNCTALTGESAQINGKYLYQIWSNVDAQDTYTDATGLDDWDCIPKNWGGPGTKAPGTCGTTTPEIKYPFSFVPASTGTTFKFSISASGTFYVDCDNGADVQVIDKQNTDVQTVTCEYSDAANKHTVRLGGLATGYSDRFAVISFTDDAAHVRSVAGCLSCIFPSFGDESDQYPSFSSTFANNTELTSVPATLFRDYTVGGDSMFRSTFSGCTKLATVPDDLFAGITVAGYMAFYYTFAGCTALTVLGDNWFQNLVSIPEQLSFMGIFDNSGVTKIGDGWFPKLTSVTRGEFWGGFGSMRSLKSIGDGWFPAMTTVEHGAFHAMFEAQPSLESVGSNWFPNLTHADENAFGSMFEKAKALKSVGDGWFPKLTTADTAAFNSMFLEATSLESVGDGWFPKLTTVGVATFGTMFYGTTSLKTIPAMFKNIKSAQEDLFSATFSNSGLTTIPDDMFASLDTSGSYPRNMFYDTFKNCTALTGESAQINGKYLYQIWSNVDAQDTYTDATGLDDWDCIPENWGGPGTKAPGTCGTTTPEIKYPFSFVPASTGTTFKFSISASGTFYVDWGDGNVQEIVREDASELTAYEHTYTDGKNASQHTVRLGGHATGYGATGVIKFAREDSGLKSIDGCLGCVFGTLNDGTQPRFSDTFTDNTSLTGQIPANLFDGVSGAPVMNMFRATFDGCSGLTGEIPSGLFAEIKGAPAQQMFWSTFNGCSGLTGSIPSDLFAGIKGAPATSMFQSTFSGCSGLTGSIPSDLFAGIEGAPWISMFRSTFSGCSKLTGEIPSELFAGIEGKIASSMFESTFSGCSSLTSIGDGLFGNIDGDPAFGSHMFKETFSGCTSLTGPSATIGTGDKKKYLYEYWHGDPKYVSMAAENCYTDATGLDDWDCIPEDWGGPGTKAPGTCGNAGPDVPAGDGTFTFVPETTGNTFRFKISATGDFVINWGDGNVSEFSRDSTTATTYEHTYTDGKNASQHTIGLDGLATGYSTSDTVAAVSFYNTDTDETYRVRSVVGCLSCVFPVISSQMGQFPRFYRTFGYNSALTTVPDTLFENITVGGDYMFAGTFRNTPNLKSVPAELFGRITDGAPRLFYYTFYGSGLTQIPTDLFASIDTNVTYPTNMFYLTFENCTAAKGYSPQIDGKYLYQIWPGVSSQYTFTNDTKLTDYDCIPKNWGGAGIKTNCSDADVDPDDPDDPIISFVEGEFKFMPETSGRTFNFQLGAKGDFTIEWGDGEVSQISKSEAVVETVSHTYADAAANLHTIGISGRASEYSAANEVPVIRFYNTDTDETYRIKSITTDSCLGCVFPTLGEDDDAVHRYPRFYQTFYKNSALTGALPDNLFKNVTGGIRYMFYQTFQDTGIDTLPVGMFEGIDDVGESMFWRTFANTNVTAVPEKFFAGIHSAANYMFDGTFYGCHSLKSIGDGLLGDIESEAQYMFNQMFYDCGALTGPSGTVGTGDKKEFMWQRWPNSMGSSAYKYDDGLSDYGQMPPYWK